MLKAKRGSAVFSMVSACREITEALRVTRIEWEHESSMDWPWLVERQFQCSFPGSTPRTWPNWTESQREHGRLGQNLS